MDASRIPNMFRVGPFKRSILYPMLCAYLPWLINLGVIKLTEKFFFRWPVFWDWFADPGYVHVMFEVNIFGNAITTPRSATQAGGHRHTVSERTSMRHGLRLGDQDATKRRY